MCQAATQNYAGILTTRFFLGLCEAGFYPGVLYHLSFWYPTDRLPLRIVSCSVLFSMAHRARLYKAVF